MATRGSSAPIFLAGLFTDAFAMGAPLLIAITRAARTHGCAYIAGIDTAVPSDHVPVATKYTERGGSVAASASWPGVRNQ